MIREKELVFFGARRRGRQPGADGADGGPDGGSSSDDGGGGGGAPASDRGASGAAKGAAAAKGFDPSALAARQGVLRGAMRLLTGSHADIGTVSDHLAAVKIFKVGSRDQTWLGLLE
jgi:hypothetical protein